jgi:hypothetical protein
VGYRGGGVGEAVSWRGVGDGYRGSGLAESCR